MVFLFNSAPFSGILGIGYTSGNLGKEYRPNQKQWR